MVEMDEQYLRALSRWRRSDESQYARRHCHAGCMHTTERELSTDACRHCRTGCGWEREQELSTDASDETGACIPRNGSFLQTPAGTASAVQWYACMHVHTHAHPQALHQPFCGMRPVARVARGKKW